MSGVVRDYLERGRHVLARRAEAAAPVDSVWLGMAGKPLNTIGMAGVFKRCALAWFGVAHGPEMARKWLQDSAVRRGPAAAWDAVEIKGHTPQMALKHYTSAVDRSASTRLAAQLAVERDRTASLAERFFTQHRRSSR